ncbi:MFS transporter [Actinokineospora globicatena]|uniref:MFS transporter n=1 Tax=Actinokineospora globicatena TaxID=103729 RepID=UPI0020A39472|nr:MFS transporter [Actinokineospora globicatena]MCP2306690.1 MFS transporter, UMF1 family [Actinokineospora globicatena]GLW82195.1 MFS transporter [Actinokineospora globicatena]GLW88988.1 MFS transporter [Actinokineospora globicatena]
MVEDSQTAEARKREQRGWCWYDWANSVFPTSVTTVFGSLYLTEVAASAAMADKGLNGPNPCPADGAGNTDKLRDCDISLFGLDFPAGSLWGYLLSIATVIQVLIVPLMGAIADRSSNKKPMMAAFAFGGALATIAMALVSGTNWELGVVLFILGNIGYGTSVVIYYSFLPQISTADERDGLSSRGWAFGYLGGGCALAIQLVIYLMRDSIGITSGNAAQIAFVLSGIWWALFTLIPLRRLRGHHERPQGTGTERSGSVLTAGFRELFTTLREARAYPLTLAFLGTYLIYTDGIATVANVSAQYGSEELKFEADVLITTILIVQFVAFIGGVLHGLLARRIGAKKTIMASLSVWVLVIGAAYFVQAGQALQFYLLAAGIGLVLGGTNALSRSLFSQLVPAGKEAQYFSVYEMGERATSWLGPLLFAVMASTTGSYRYAIISLVIFFAVGLILMSFVPVRRAIRAAGNPEPALL